MRSKEKCRKTGFSIILWVVMAVILCASPILKADVTVPAGEKLDIDYPVTGNLYVDGTANLKTGASVTDSIYVQDGGTLNMYSGTVGFFISVALNASGMTIYGTNFAIDGDPIVEYGSYPFPYNTVTGLYGDGSQINLLIMSGIDIHLLEAGVEPPENQLPIADAGPDITIFTNDIATTIINGIATDPDTGDSLQYRWLEGAVEFTSWADVGENDEAPLDLSIILSQYLSVGTHTLTLEVSDGAEIDSDDMILTIEIAPIDIDIKPGSDPNPINQGSNGLIPVAIFSSPEFDATTVLPETVSLGGAGVAVRGKGTKYMAHEQDVNGDGDIDLIVQVETDGLDQVGANGEVELTAETSDGTSIIGYDVIVIVPPEG